MSNKIGQIDYATLSGIGPAIEPSIAAPALLDWPEVLEIAAPSGGFQPAITALPPVTASFAGNYFFDYYFRIYVVPETIEAQNPQIGTDIPFAIWNAYPDPPPTNALNAINTIGANGLELDLAPGAMFDALEYRTVNIQITPAADIEIDAEFTFDFALGDGKLFFRATIATFVQMQPDPPVEEEWEWLTDVISARDGTEQRIALRASPRRSINYSFLLEDETERRRQYNRWFGSLASRIVLPFYQYGTRLTAASSIGDSQLYFDPARTDLRAGEYAMLFDLITEEGALVKLDSVGVDGATVSNPLTIATHKKMVIAPAFASRLYDRSGFAMRQVTGKITIQADVLTPRLVFARPGSAATIEMFDSLPVLDRRPLADGETPELFDVNYEVADGRTGLQSIYSSWPHPQIGTVRRWTIRRLTNPVEMDWWRDFLDAASGRQNPFLMPTWFADLLLAEEATPGIISLKIVGNEYALGKFPYEAFKRLQIETDGGIIWRKVVTAVDNGDGTSTISLDAPLGLNPADGVVSRISFLNLVRLASDRVSLKHGSMRSEISLATRTVDQ